MNKLFKKCVLFVMIVGFIPWGDFGITFFDSWTVIFIG